MIIYHLKSTATTSGTDQFDFGNPFWRRYRSEEISPLLNFSIFIDTIWYLFFVWEIKFDICISFERYNLIFVFRLRNTIWYLFFVWEIQFDTNFLFEWYYLIFVFISEIQFDRHLDLVFLALVHAQELFWCQSKSK